MTILTQTLLKILIAILAAYGWCFVYPYASLNHYGDMLLTALFILFLAALFLAPKKWRKPVLVFSSISSLAGIITTIWIILSWRLGVWFPSLPSILHQLFSTDGESSYHATDGQLFLILFLFFSIIYLTINRHKR